jgi:membrane protease YdiL (CAAX protease family)
MNNERKDLAFYAAAVLVPTTLLAACFPLFHLTNNWLENALMFIPGLMAAALLLQRRQGFRAIGWGVPPVIYLLFAVVLPMVLLAMTLPLSLRLGYAASGRSITLLKILKNVAIYTAISIPFALGEEFGWRGYAQGKLVRQFGLAKGLLLLGLFWGVWHIPIYYFTGAFKEHPFFGPFVMTPIDNILAVVPMGWLYIKSRNIWVPTLTHAFADVLIGFSDILYPKHQEIQSWAVLQFAQLIISIVLFIDLKRTSTERADPMLESVAVSG